MTLVRHHHRTAVVTATDGITATIWMHGFVPQVVPVAELEPVEPVQFTLVQLDKSGRREEREWARVKR